MIHMHLYKYSLCQKKCTFNSEFFCGPPGEGRPKIHMVDYVNGSSTHAQFFPFTNFFLLGLTWSSMWIFGPPLPGGPQKKSELNVRFFWHRLYLHVLFNPVFIMVRKLDAKYPSSSRGEPGSCTLIFCPWTVLHPPRSFNFWCGLELKPTYPHKLI